MRHAARKRPSLIRRISSSLRAQDPIEDGLNALSERLGLCEHQEAKPDHLACEVHSASDIPSSIIYAPDMDGQVDPGEVVWFWAPSDHSPQHVVERSLVVVARTAESIYGLLTSPNPDHETDDHWMDIGSGPWDASGRQSWVRVDKIVTVPETHIRRQGIVMPQQRFERIANRLRQEYGWR
ncbi:type II toxin-antitoxin system PemK/MazF family toxin [Corynebacterium pseudopelargi]|uniref:PemK-like protein n=1 Tax=Corynebacterium pseudopelargi TaxID=2080757 RepID=A0A3G6IT25_9CORY|nr:type II toxin-antitoxin system PemK/MazF family toxin [Corynebacterium pseudopelargi]AZA08763.1 PemK-like protein [Corynebacterium pseudopelargi]